MPALLARALHSDWQPTVAWSRVFELFVLLPCQAPWSRCAPRSGYGIVSALAEFACLYCIQADGEDGSAAADYSTGFVTDRLDIAPQQWTNGYLVGVDSMFLGVDGSGTAVSGNVDIAIVLECTLESATQASATALALSQQ